MLIVIMVNVVMMSDVMLSPVFIAMLRVILLNFFMLSVVVPQENFSLMETLKNYNHKMFNDISPGTNVIKPFTVIIYYF